MKKLFTFWLALCFWGCISPNNPPGNTFTPRTSANVLPQVYVQEDTHKKTIIFPPLHAYTVPYGIAVIQKPNTPDMYIVYVSESENSGPLKEAQTENGNKLSLISLNPPVHTGNTPSSFAASVGVQINLAFLEKNRGRNPRIKVLGQQNSFVIFLPDDYIAAVLQYVHQL